MPTLQSCLYRSRLAVILALSACSRPASLGIFEDQVDIGKDVPAGSVVWNADLESYRVTGGGRNIWGTEDAFHFAWKRLSGDVMLGGRVDWEGQGAESHRKAGWMIRQDLGPGSAYADVMVHGDGLISLQFRTRSGADTQEVRSPVGAPARVRLERHGGLFSLSVAGNDEIFQPVASVTVELQDPVYAGLAVSAHHAQATETAVFSEVEFEESGPWEDDQRVLESTLEVVSTDTGIRRIVYRAQDHFEAPNWSIDGESLLFNRSGRLYRIPVAGGEPVLVDTGSAQRCNNDHGFSPDGRWLAISHSPENRSLIYVLPAAGGEPRLVTPSGPSYWHGWSPDGKTLAYCAERQGEYDVYTISVEGGREKRLTSAEGLDDGPDYSPDGRYIYFNSVRSGIMQIWRMGANGENPERITRDENYADWFPHPSPDGRFLVFLSYDKSVEGHPPEKNVTLRLLELASDQPRVLAVLFGGQGTINVPSWSPTSRQLAFVSYRRVGPGTR